MTSDQIARRKAHLEARRQFEIAGHGEKTKTRRALELAAIEVLKADSAARREREQRRIAA